VAGSKLDQDDDDQAITDINVTPFVDVALVLLIIFMVTARLIVARGIEIDKPKMDAGGEVASTLRVTVDKDGKIYVNGTTFPDQAGAIARIKQIAGPMAKPKAIIAGDQRAQYRGVMDAIGMVKAAGIDAIALENVQK